MVLGDSPKHNSCLLYVRLFRSIKKRGAQNQMKTIQITDKTYHDLLQIKADASLDGSKRVLSMDDVVQFLLMEKEK